MVLPPQKIPPAPQKQTCLLPHHRRRPPHLSLPPHHQKSNEWLQAEEAEKAAQHVEAGPSFVERQSTACLHPGGRCCPFVAALGAAGACAAHPTLC